MKILALTKYSKKGPSSRYRYYNYMNCFQQNNIDMIISPFFTDKYFDSTSKMTQLINIIYSYIYRLLVILRLLFNKKYSLIIIEYEIFPYFPSIFEKLLKYKKIPYLADYDDAVFHKYNKHKNFIIRWLFKNKIPKVMQNAEMVIIGNDYLENYAKIYNDKTLLLPTVVLLDRYIEAMKYYKNSIINKPFTIGWIGSKTTSEYILVILPAIERFVDLHDAQCNLIGFDESLITSEIKEKCKINFIPWSEESEIEEILKFDIGVMPLPDTPWAKGKCGFKLIQYMSCKKPVVASPIGVNKSIIANGNNGYLASTVDEWFDAFQAIFNDVELRKHMSKNNWDKVTRQFNYQINCRKYIDVINNTKIKVV